MKDRRPKEKRRHPPRPSLPTPLRGPGAATRPAAAPPGGGDAPSPATHWGEAAEWYDQLVGDEGSEYHRHVVLPGALRLLAAKPGDNVLDIACGQGVLCRMLARQGVATTGVDAAVDLIRMAKDRNAQLENKSAAGSGQSAVETAPPSPSLMPTAPTYFTADARELSFLREGDFTAAACLLAIQNLHPINPVCAGVARALRVGGRFVIVMMHPCFRGPKETSWGWDEGGKVQYRRVDRYLLPRKAPILTNPGRNKDYTWTFHKPIEAYVKALAHAGLFVDAMEEWPSHKTSTSGPRAPAENVARKEIPMFLAIRGVKFAGAVAPPVEAEQKEDSDAAEHPS